MIYDIDHYLPSRLIGQNYITSIRLYKKYKTINIDVRKLERGMEFKNELIFNYNKQYIGNNKDIVTFTTADGKIYKFQDNYIIKTDFNGLLPEKDLDIKRRADCSIVKRVSEIDHQSSNNMAYNKNKKRQLKLSRRLSLRQYPFH